MTATAQGTALEQLTMAQVEVYHHLDVALEHADAAVFYAGRDRVVVVRRNRGVSEQAILNEVEAVLPSLKPNEPQVLLLRLEQ